MTKQVQSIPRFILTCFLCFAVLFDVTFGLLSPSARPGFVSTSSLGQSRRSSYDYYNDYDERYDDPLEKDKDEPKGDGYWEEKESPSDKNGAERRGGVYKVYFDSDIDEAREIQLDWETCFDGENEALVLLPPEAVQRPSAILHFVGGTFFGSAPKLWYRFFLEGLVRNTQCAIVITPIPVTLLKSPLQHVSLCKKLI